MPEASNENIETLIAGYREHAKWLMNAAGLVDEVNNRMASGEDERYRIGARGEELRKAISDLEVMVRYFHLKLMAQDNLIWTSSPETTQQQ